MNSENTDLSQLRDVALPDPVSWWPPAPGWFVLGAVLVILALAIAFKLHMKWKENAYRRAALRELATAGSSDAVARILRRVALASTSRETIAALHGSQWIDWLASRSPGSIPPSVSEDLGYGLYGLQNGKAVDKELKRFAWNWIKRHRKI